MGDVSPASDSRPQLLEREAKVDDKGASLRDMQIVDVGPEDHPQLLVLLPVLKELRPHLTEESYASIYSLGHKQGYRLSAAFRGGADGPAECLGVAGWRVMDCMSFIRVLFVEDLVTRSSERSTGVGKTLLDYLEGKAREAGCKKLCLDSAVHRTGAHRFYYRERLSITAYHFDKELEPIA